MINLGTIVKAIRTKKVIVAMIAGAVGAGAVATGLIMHKSKDISEVEINEVETEEAEETIEAEKVIIIDDNFDEKEEEKQK